MASNDPKPDTAANNKPENASDDARADVTAAVEELLNSLSNKFAGVSSEIFAKTLQESNKPKDGSSTKTS
ncbi:heat shock factor binding protein 1 [Fusarium flagelliforme]|uniref:Heat shock factor binding protein 1 n=1 Tax=Fusarium flagelliforme TaxID=2675880 RepID=A0A395MIK9_9HYPO|nr:heat shock factor binding protein 1 [Fusarium flagelliforme]